MAGAQDHARFQSTASVAVHGALTCDALPGPQALAATSTAEDATVPFRCVGRTPEDGTVPRGDGKLPAADLIRAPESAPLELLDRPPNRRSAAYPPRSGAGVGLCEVHQPSRVTTDSGAVHSIRVALIHPVRREASCRPNATKRSGDDLCGSRQKPTSASRGNGSGASDRGERWASGPVPIHAAERQGRAGSAAASRGGVPITGPVLGSSSLAVPVNASSAAPPSRRSPRSHTQSKCREASGL